MTRTLEFGLADLGVTRAAVVRECGGVGDALAQTLDQTIDALLVEAAKHARPRAGWVVTDESFDTGPILADLLEGATRRAVFLATLGAEFDRWSRAFFDADDPFQGFVANAIGSVAVEGTVDRLEAEVEAEAQARGDSVTSRVSPGYCGWDVADQHRLFALLPQGFLDVRLTDAALMIPLKSVSGVIGIGPDATRRPYPCAECETDDCPSHGRGRR